MNRAVVSKPTTRIGAVDEDENSKLVGGGSVAWDSDSEDSSTLCGLVFAWRYLLLFLLLFGLATLGLMSIPETEAVGSNSTR